MEQEPLNNLQQKAAEKLYPEGRRLFFEYIKKEEHNPHLEHFIEALANDVLNLNEVFTYGMQHLPADEQRPDKMLANYFFFISEITGITDEIQSFAVDCMVYCETDMYDGMVKRENIFSDFEKIKPLLA